MADWFMVHGIRILAIILISTVICLLLRHFVRLLIKKSVSRQMKGQPEGEIKKRTDTLSSIFVTTGIVIIAILTIFTILPEFGVNTAAALASLGIVGIAVGFGAQYLIRDLIAGFFILLENQFNVGDVIRTGTIAGGVEEISIRRTILRDLDGARHMIPNGEIRTVSNLTQGWSRAHLNISVAYKEDLDRVMGLMRKTWEEMAQDRNWSPFMKVETPWLLRVDEFGNSGIIIKMVGETEPIKQWDVMGEFRRRIKKVFDQEGIEIPWPHTKVYFGNAPPTAEGTQPMPEKSTNTKAGPP